MKNARKVKIAENTYIESLRAITQEERQILKNSCSPLADDVVSDVRIVDKKRLRTIKKISEKRTIPLNDVFSFKIDA